MLTSLGLIFLLGLLMAAVCQRIHLPRIIGMLLTGIILGPYVLDLLDVSILNISSELRQIALIIILLKAGLSLDLKDLKKVGRSAVMLACVPATCELLAFVIFAPMILNISRVDAAVMGAVLAAVSPAVVVPRMVHLMENSYGMDQVFLLCSNLFRRPGQCSFSLLLTLAFPAQSVIAQRGPTAGTGIFQTHIFRLLSDDRKTPCDTLPLGQADAGREKAAQNQDLYPKALCLTIFCCLSRPFGHGYSSLSICFHLPHMLFYPLHLVHQSPDLEVHHILRHLWE